MTEPEYEKKKSPARRGYERVKAVVIWLRTRRSSRAVANAISSNQAAVLALAASVGAAGIGAYATVEAKDASDKADQAKSQAAALANRLAAVETDIRMAHASMAELEAGLETIKVQRAQDLKNLKRQLNRMDDRVMDVRDEVRSLPAVPDSKPAIERAKDLAVKAGNAADKALATAQAALVRADDSEDEVARQAAQEAIVAALDAQAAADLAKQDADRANTAIDNLPAGYQPLPRTVYIPSDSRTNNANPYSYSFTVDLPAGNYSARLVGEVNHTAQGHWSARLNNVTVDSGFDANLDYTLEFPWPGGTKTFVFWFDGDVVGPGSVSVSNISVTFEEIQP